MQILINHQQEQQSVYMTVLISFTIIADQIIVYTKTILMYTVHLVCIGATRGGAKRAKAPPPPPPP